MQQTAVGRRLLHPVRVVVEVRLRRPAHRHALQPVLRRPRQRLHRHRRRDPPARPLTVENSRRWRRRSIRISATDGDIILLCEVGRIWKSRFIPTCFNAFA